MNIPPGSACNKKVAHGPATTPAVSQEKTFYIIGLPPERSLRRDSP